ncbi:MAG: PEP-CTERM sorting domain-containing protein [Gammaproteobacteria bacterium]|nr:PEP-CTERM sorting domain-containing protein [Gammaproteobacteria bacterium]MBL6999390.1 PEP-CTERM sorting domain-containing protein [Gammaproteobacteria bacterium]
MLQNIRHTLFTLLCTTSLFMSSFSVYARDNVVPEPSILSLFALGVVGILVLKRFRKK